MILKNAWNRMRPNRGCSRKRWIGVGVVALALAASMASQTSPRADRIVQGVNPAEAVKIAGSVPLAARRATDMGEVNSGMQLESLTLNIGLSVAQQADLNALLAAQQDPRSPQYHQWLTQDEYGARFGLTDADLSKVTQWLESEGFTVTRVAPSRNLIMFSGTAAKAELAFGTRVHEYMEADGSTHIGNTAEISIPAALSGVVVGMRGLSGFRPKPHAVRRANPAFTSGSSGNHFLAPGDWAAIYSVNGVYNTYGVTGTGMQVGVAGQTYIPETDITAFRTAAFGAGTATNLNYVCISSSTYCGLQTPPNNEGIGDVGEADLDVEWSGGIAKDATVDFIYAGWNDPQLGVFDALVYGITTYTVNGAVVPVIGVSYGDCEYYVASFGSSFGKYGSYSGYEIYFAEAAAQGQTLAISSGDDGAGCTISATNELADQGESVSWPASSLSVTAVGGTTFSADGTAASPITYADPPYWNANGSTDVLTSALEYIPEVGWNDTAYDKAVDPSGWTLSASGGGVSMLYTTTPSWQSGVLSGQPTGRMVPDISFSASADHDPYLVCTQNFPSTDNPAYPPPSNPGTTCVNGFRQSNGDLTAYGGTSASVQAFSGMLTLMVQAYGKQGNINQKLYSLAANLGTYPGVFNDIKTGSNSVPCTTGKTGCPSGTTTGYSAGTGYDMVTGLGSMNGGALYTALGGGVTVGGGTTYSMTPSMMAVPLSDGGSQVVGLTLTSSGFTGTVTLATVVTLNGQTTSLVTATVTGNPVTLSGSGSSQTPSVTITAGTTAANHAPAMPWKSGGAMVLAAMVGVPFTLRRRRALAVLLTMLAITTAGFMLACGGGTSSSGASTKPAGRTYVVLVTPTATPTGGSAVIGTPKAITVTVQ